MIWDTDKHGMPACFLSGCEFSTTAITDVQTFLRLGTKTFACKLENARFRFHQTNDITEDGNIKVWSKLTTRP